MTVAIDTANTQTSASGGYALAVDPPGGPATITFSGGSLASNVTFVTELSAGLNIKLDIIDGNFLQTSASGTIGGGAIKTVRGLGLTGLTLTTGGGSQTIIG